MRLYLHADPERLRKPFSLACSVGLHGAVLAWVALQPLFQDQTPGVYERQIRPHASRIVWYSLKQKLPPISPVERPRDQRSARALTRSPQTLVAGPQDLLRPPQLIWTPAPPFEQPRMLHSPNIVALVPPPRPQPRDFVPPPEAPAKAPLAVLPAAPQLTLAMANRTSSANPLPPIAAARKIFIPPLEAVHQATPIPVSLPAAPRITETTPGRPVLTTAMAKPLRAFTPPEPGNQQLPPPPAPFAEAPPFPPVNRAPDASLAIVGLFPTRNPEVPIPNASQQAGFSVGPQPRPIGGDDSSQPSQLVIPGLLARSGAPPAPADRQSLLTATLEPPTSLRNLLTAARSARTADPPPRPDSPASDAAAVRVAEPPDPRLQGRMVYSMALQMPNVTSYSGSWIVWFAERGSGLPSFAPQSAPNMRPPSPVRKVDPKYVPAAVQDRVEGKVRLAAVIRKDGSVDTVEVLQGLDTRLDRSAAEALAKWEFQPAQRNGAPIEVDAVFDIPFHLAPRAAK